VDFHELAGRPGILGRDQVGPAQDIERAQRDVAGRAVIARGLAVFAAPGASAVLAALAVSGLPTDRFAFVGFMPPARAARRAALAELRDLGMTLVFYESPKRVSDLLGDLAQDWGGSREAVVCRELTKKFEEVSRGTLEALAAAFADRDPKGEIVVLVAPAGRRRATTRSPKRCAWRCVARG